MHGISVIFTSFERLSFVTYLTKQCFGLPLLNHSVWPLRFSFIIFSNFILFKIQTFILMIHIIALKLGRLKFIKSSAWMICKASSSIYRDNYHSSSEIHKEFSWIF